MRRTPFARSVLASLLVTTLLTVATPVARAADDAADDPGLAQQIDPSQGSGVGRAVLDHGHVDLGPRLVDGAWQLQVHDDTATPPVWRAPDDVVLAVPDAAVLTVPTDPAYAFLHQEPGTAVHVLPQTQNADVVWVGWNTQDPAVMDAVDLGVTLSLTGVQGPGDVVVYLQSGNLGAPTVLWDSTTGQAQELWIDVNTHTHANWVFTEPGTYLLRLAATAKLKSGQEVTDEQVLRLAVGDAARPDDAFSAVFDPVNAFAAQGAPSVSAGAGGAESVDTGGGSGVADDEATVPDATDDRGVGLVPVIVTVLVVGLLVVGLVSVLRGRQARRQAHDRLGGDRQRGAGADR